MYLVSPNVPTFQVGGPPAQMMRQLQPTNRKFYDNFSSEIIHI